MSLRLPPSIQSIIGPGGRIDPHWERWLGDLVRQINTPVQSGGEVAPVEPPALVQGYGIAVTGAGTQDSPWVVRLREIADSGTGALLGITRDAYGRITGTVDATITGTTGEIEVANGDAVAGKPTLSLSDVTPTTGGTLKKYGFDAKGRRDKQDDATTDDLTEGATNLYFTDERAQDAVGAAIAAGSGDGVTLSYDDAGNAIGATNTDKGSVAVTAHEAEADPHGQYILETEKGAANGIAPLKSDGTIDTAYLPAAVLGQVEYKGTWDASSGVPTATPEKGWYYVVTVAGSTDLSGITDWQVGDWAIYNGSAWDKIDNTDAISSWNGRTGAVVPQAGDYTPAQVGADPAGSAASAQAYAVQRGNHTGTQLASTISDFADTVRSTILTGLSTATNAAIAATDTVLQALGKLQAQITALAASLSGYVPTSRTISTTAPLSGGGNLTANRTLSITAATTSAAGSMSAADKAKLDGIASGATAYTDANARAAAVADSITDGVTNVAPSQNAVFDALAGKFDKAGGTVMGVTKFSASPLSVISSSGPSQVHVDCPAGQVADFLFKDGGLTKWVFRKNASNNFELSAFGGAGASLLVEHATGTTRAGGADGTKKLGDAPFRWADVYSVNAANNTSDAREKTTPRHLTPDELAAALDIARLPCIFQWLAAIEEKGEAARLHVSPTVQDVIAAMESHGLDPFRYGFVCYDEWDETPEVTETEPAEYDDEGNLVREEQTVVVQEYRPAGNRYSLRPSELAHFIQSAIVQEQDSIKARLAALEGQ